MNDLSGGGQKMFFLDAEFLHFGDQRCRREAQSDGGAMGAGDTTVTFFYCL